MLVSSSFSSFAVGTWELYPLFSIFNGIQAAAAQAHNNNISNVQQNSMCTSEAK